MLTWLKKKSNFLTVDLHSHLIPEIDDGAKSWDESIALVTALSQLGYKKIITTPHIIHDYYPNTISVITKGVQKLNALLSEKNINVIVEPGAEYFIDEHFAKQAKASSEFLTFGDNYILIETPFVNKPIFLEEVIFNLQSKGLKPILAHPERYAYLTQNPDLLDQLISNGVYMQVNINSLTGYYSKEAHLFAKKLIASNKIHFLATDLHNHKHLEQLKKTIKSRLFQKCRQLELLNSTL